MLTQPISRTNADAAPEQVQHGPDVADDFVLQEQREAAEAGVLQDLPELRKPLVVARVDGVELLLRLRQASRPA